MEHNLTLLYKKLESRYGHLNWWPAETPYEVIAGAILTQNTAWSNVEKAIANFGGRLLPETVESLDMDELAAIIRPSGYCGRKALYLKEVTRWFRGYDYRAENVRRQPLNHVRKELLDVLGVGKETADSILLYAFEYPTFVVDAYTKRLFERLPVDIKLDYDIIKQYFESRLAPDARLYNNYHALIVINAKEHCKSKPVCLGCPLSDECSFSLRE